MRPLFQASFCVSVLVGLMSGCASEQNTAVPASAPATVGDKADKIPAFLVGVWEAKIKGPVRTSTWAVQLEPDGSIPKIIHHWAGPINVSEGGAYGEGPDPDTHYFYVMGPCGATYDPAERKLSVKIVLDYWEMKLPQGTIRGRQEDYLSGPVSANGKTWQAKWLNFAYLQGAAPLDKDLIRKNAPTLLFKKLDLSAAKTRFEQAKRSKPRPPQPGTPQLKN